MTHFFKFYRRGIFFLLMGGVLAGCASVNRSTPAKAFLISQSGIGPIQLGMTAAEVGVKLGAGYRIQAPAGNPERESAAWYRVKNPQNQEIARFLVRDWQRQTAVSPIVQIRTRDVRFRTANHVGPGSSLMSVQQIWGAASFQMAGMGSGDEQARFEKQPDYLTLTVNGVGPTPVEVYTTLESEDFRQERAIRYWIAGAKISTITVTQRERKTSARSARGLRSTDEGAALVNPPPMRARVPTLRLD